MSKYKIIKFGKEGCTPCKNVDDYLQSKNVEYTKIDVTKEDDETLEFCERYGVGMSIPKTMLIDNKTDEIILNKTGFNPSALNMVIEEYEKGL